MFGGIIIWGKSLLVVCKPFIQTAIIWLLWQVGIGFTAWSAARFYGIHCAPPGVNGFVSSLVLMGSPICISAWISHAGFVITYITSFIVSCMIIILWCWKKTNNTGIIQQIRTEMQATNL
tara:strand:+ start:1432 stop:1791 length:360 start_codon:yes stop_codon:yes gene_type:complete